ncbi:ComEC/Rec2 family competence protein [Streptomyces lydicus]|uniref:ComEC/Rec2 family competence protein n=1 Tax=Streptomyces lydicus TaxID=47763 RepID=UPI0010136094|nr:hypothetical protein [Streptomyces lydicus]MCZ1006774.1 hypothetical protein [Streptomyces lydicus]
MADSVLVDGGGVPVEVVFFNVGQGDCTLLWFYDRGTDPATGTGTHAVLIDCGSAAATAPSRNPTGPGADGDAKARMLAHLRTKLDGYLTRLRTPRALDYLVITHPDKDHFNLLQDVLLNNDGELRYTLRKVLYTLEPGDYREAGQTFIRDLLTDPDRLANADGFGVETWPQQTFVPTTPQPLLEGRREGIDSNLYLLGGGWFGPGMDRMSGGSSWDADDYEATSKERIANQSSLVLLLLGEPDPGDAGKRQKVLFMADAEEVNEHVLIGLDRTGEFRRESNLWLKMGHHGSGSSTCDAWLEHLRPDGLFISTGMLAFRGGAGTCNATNIQLRVLPYWRGVRARHGIPLPRVSSGGWWGYGFQNNTGRKPWKIWYQPTKEGVFSTFAVPGFPAGGPITGDPADPGVVPPEPVETANLTAWRGVDWHLTIDHAAPGAYDIRFA